MKRFLSITLILVFILSMGTITNAKSAWTPLEPEDFFDAVWESYESAAGDMLKAYPKDVLPAFHPSRNFENLQDSDAIIFQMGVITDVVYSRATGASVIISGMSKSNETLAEVVAVLVQVLFDMEFQEAASFMADNVGYMLDHNTDTYVSGEVLVGFEANTDGDFVLLIGRLPVEVYE